MTSLMMLLQASVAMTTQAALPPEFPDMMVLFRQTIALMGREAFESQILAKVNDEPMGCCAASHVSNMS